MKSQLLDCSKIRTTYTNLNRKDFSKAINIPYTTYLDYEKGRNPDLESMVKISNYLGVSIDTLLERETKEPTPVEEDSALTADQKGIIAIAKKLPPRLANKAYGYLLGLIDATSDDSDINKII